MPYLWYVVSALVSILFEITLGYMESTSGYIESTFGYNGSNLEHSESTVKVLVYVFMNDIYKITTIFALRR